MHRAWSITGHRSPPLSLLRMTHPSRDLQDPRYGASDLFSHRASTIKRWRGEGRGGPKNNLAPPSPCLTSSSLHALSNPLDMDTERSDSSALGIMIPGFPREREGGREKYLPRPGHPCEIVTRESKHGAVVACGSDHYRGKESERRVARIHTLRALPVKYWSLDVSVVGLFPVDQRSSIS